MIGAVPREKNRSAKFDCVCDCGTQKAVAYGNLVSGRTVSCGCFMREQTSRANSTHRLCGTPEYVSWASMRQRCNNPNTTEYADYGGRGIKVCPRWDRFEDFLADMGPRPSLAYSLERIDNDGGYEPGNCRWALDIEQVYNRRITRKITYNGKTQNIRQWERETGIPFDVIASRYKEGWTPDKIFQTPVRGFIYPPQTCPCCGQTFAPRARRA